MLLADLVGPSLQLKRSALMRRPSFLLRSYVQAYEPDDPKTHGGRNLERMSMRELYEAFGLLETTIDFVVRARCEGCRSMDQPAALHSSALGVDAASSWRASSLAHAYSR